MRDLEGRSGSINIMAAAEGYWSRVFIRSYYSTFCVPTDEVEDPCTHMEITERMLEGCRLLS